MSFDVNIGRSEPIIKAASNMNNDGGSGGNLGYMMRGKKKKDENNSNIFDLEKQKTDSFEFSSIGMKEPDFNSDNKSSWVNNLLNKFKK